ncbi:MAG: GntR family transcriptional regulator [Lachnospiraceae bacterium]|nr:GntR family transcriptional regulator [Lachnospiraceae bacterium]
MLIEIDFNSSEALYMQLRNQIILGIARDMLRDGDSLPSVRQLASELGVNMHTVNKAYALLRQDGYVKLDRRNGAVISVSLENRSYQVESIHSDMEMIVAQAICKDISLNEMQKLVQDMYDAFSARQTSIDIIVEEKE